MATERVCLKQKAILIFTNWASVTYSLSNFVFPCTVFHDRSLQPSEPSSTQTDDSLRVWYGLRPNRATSDSLCQALWVPLFIAIMFSYTRTWLSHETKMLIFVSELERRFSFWMRFPAKYSWRVIIPMSNDFSIVYIWRSKWAAFKYFVYYVWTLFVDNFVQLKCTTFWFRFTHNILLAILFIKRVCVVLYLAIWNMIHGSVKEKENQDL